MRLRIALALIFFLAVANESMADSWPSRPIHWIVPYPAGGGTDLMARTIGAELKNILGQTIVVENKSGGSTVVGTSALTAADPDGYTFGMIFDSLAINKALGVNTPYDPEKDIVLTCPGFFGPSFVREWTCKELGNAEEAVQWGADCCAAAPD
jgi:tripartite-type tricarboxylate transporter receptor subunit TctC